MGTTYNKHTSPDDRRLCVELWLANVPQKEIAEKLEIHRETVRRTIDDYRLPRSEHERLDRLNAQAILDRTITNDIPVFGKKRSQL